MVQSQYAETYRSIVGTIKRCSSTLISLERAGGELSPSAARLRFLLAHRSGRSRQGASVEEEYSAVCGLGKSVRPIAEPSEAANLPSALPGDGPDPSFSETAAFFFDFLAAPTAHCLSTFATYVRRCLSSASPDATCDVGEGTGSIGEGTSPNAQLHRLAFFSPAVLAEAFPLERDMPHISRSVSAASVEPSGRVVVHVLVDGGANTCLMGSPLLIAASEKRPANVSIAGVWDAAAPSITEAGTVRLALPLIDGGEHRFDFEAPIAPLSRRDIWSESVMYDIMAARVLKEPIMRIELSDGAAAPLYRADGLYFVTMYIVERHEPCPLVVNLVSDALDLRDPRTWAARFGVRGDRLRAISAASPDLGIGPVSNRAGRAADSDAIIKRTCVRDVVAPRTPKEERPVTPGVEFVLDCWGPAAAVSVIDGARFELTAVDTSSSFGYLANTRNHTTKVWLAFALQVVGLERSLGHDQWLTFRFDRTPELNDRVAFDEDALKAALLEHRVLVAFAPRNRSEGVAAASSHQRILECRAEGFMHRARKGMAFLLAARAYAHEMLMLEPANHGAVSRIVAHGYTLPDFAKRPPYAFGTDVAILNVPTERGPKGVTPFTATPSARAPTSDGIVVGYHRHNYVVLSQQGRALKPPFVTPLNELELVARGLPLNGVDVGTQTEAPAAVPKHGLQADAYAVHPFAGRVRPESVTNVLHEHGERCVPYESDPTIGGSKAGDLEVDSIVKHLTDESALGRVWLAMAGVPCATGSSMCAKSLDGDGGPPVVRTVEDPDGLLVTDRRWRAWVNRSNRLGIRLRPLFLNIIERWGIVVLEGNASRGINAPGGTRSQEPGLEWHSTVLQGTAWEDVTSQLTPYLIHMCMAGHQAQKPSDIYVSPRLVPFVGPFLESLVCDASHEHEPLLTSAQLKQAAEWRPRLVRGLVTAAVAYKKTLFPSPPKRMRKSPDSFFPEQTSFEEHAPPELKGPPSARVASARPNRGRRAPGSIMEAVVNVVDASPPGGERTAFEDAVAQFAPHLDDVCKGSRTLEDAYARLRDAEARSPPEARVAFYCGALEVLKAVQTEHRIETEMGVQVFKVPATLKELLASPQREQWLESMREAIRVILDAGNGLIRADEAKREQYELVRSVAIRKFKVEDPPPGTPVDAPLKLRPDRGFNTRVCADEVQMRMRLERKGVELPRAPRKTEMADMLLILLFIARAASHRRSLAKIDITNAYGKGERLGRRPVVMRIDAAVRDEFNDEDGCERYIILFRPHFGEEPSGDEFDIELVDRRLIPAGWLRVEGVPAMLALHTEPRAHMIRIVDDLLIAQDNVDGAMCYDAFKATCAVIGKAFGDSQYTSAVEPSAYAGLFIQYKRELDMINVSMPFHVINAVRRFCPGIETGESPLKQLPKGISFWKLLDALVLVPASERSTPLAAPQVRFREAVGVLRFVEHVDPNLSLPLQRSATVLAYPPMGTELFGVSLSAPLCSVIVDCLMELAWTRRVVGLTYGGRGGASALDVSLASAPRTLAAGAPYALEGNTDATWSREDGAPEASHADIFCILLTAACAAIFVQVKRINLVCESSYDTEGVGLVRGAQAIARARTIDEALLGVSLPATRVNIDSESLRLVVTRQGAPGLSRASARRYVVLNKRFGAGEINPQHQPDTEMMADFGTKWLPSAKLRASLRYASNSIAWFGECAAYLVRRL